MIPFPMSPYFVRTLGPSSIGLQTLFFARIEAAMDFVDGAVRPGLTASVFCSRTRTLVYEGRVS